jgi:hypothetical protein
MSQKEQKNKCSFLILPMLGYNKDFFGWSKNLVNCFIKDLNYPEYDNHIILKYEYPKVLNEKDIQDMVTQEANLNELSDFLVKRYEPSVNSSVFIYLVPKEHQSDYDWFRYGKYSKLSPKFKEQILSFHQGTNIKGIIGVLSRNQVMLKNLHKNLGCMSESCKCKHYNYTSCNKFKDYTFDFDKSEIWSIPGEEEILYTSIEEPGAFRIE